MTTSSDVWTRGVKSYVEYFAESCAAPPPDVVASDTLNAHKPYSVADSTQRITRFDPSALRHTVGDATSNVALVQNVLCNTGPVVALADSGLWQFARQPGSFSKVAKHEADYYDWFNWVLSYPATNAINAVHDMLYAAANADVPANGESRSDKVNKTHGGGIADIMHQWSRGHEETPCTPHEFKRDKVLRVLDRSVLDFLVEQAGASSGYNFRSSAPFSTLEGKGKNIISQARRLFHLQPASNTLSRL